MIATANEDITPPGFPHLLSVDWEPPYRASRILALIGGAFGLTVDDMAAVQLDTHSALADALVPALLRTQPADGRAREAVAILRAWDRRMLAASKGACIFATWIAHVVREVVGPELGADGDDIYFGRGTWTLRPYLALIALPGDVFDAAAERALGAACAELESVLGPNPHGWRWGTLHEAWFRHPLEPSMPELSGGRVPAPGGIDTVNVGGYSPGERYRSAGIPGYRQIIDLSDFDASLGVVPPGVSGNPASPFHHNQLESWRTGQYHSMPFTAAAVDAATCGRLMLTP